MRSYRIAVIGGDGVGPEVIGASISVLNRVADIDSSPVFKIVLTAPREVLVVQQVKIRTPDLGESKT